MRNFKNNRRRYRSNSFERNLKINSNDQNLNSSLGNVSDFRRKNYSKNHFNSSKLIQKYSDLAREALSIGDKILSENYLQHVDHFTRIVLHKNSQQTVEKNNVQNDSKDSKPVSKESEINQDTILPEDKKNI